MTLKQLTEISRRDLETRADEASVTDVRHLSSYNWLEAPEPTIAVPGCPPLWSPPKAARNVIKDSGLIYIAQNAARHPEYPLEPLFRALYIDHPSFELQSVDLITDRNNIRKLLSFVNPNISKNGLEPFTIHVEAFKNTVIFCRAETETKKFVQPHEFIGYGHEFEKAFTTDKIGSSTGHHRLISYRFGDLKIMVRYETDGYIDKPRMGKSVADNDVLASMIQSLSLDSVSTASTSSKLKIKRAGEVVDFDSTLEIKTRVSHKPIDLEEVLPQLWVSQTPNLVRAYHKHGLFEPPKVENVAPEIKKWEESHQLDLQCLATLIRKIILIVTGNQGNAIIKYDPQVDKLVLWQTDGPKMLPDDLYSKFGNDEKKSQKDSISVAASTKTKIGIGEALYDIDVSRIPYLSSFVRFQSAAQPHTSEFTHNSIPLFDTALKGLESGYRACFRLLPADLSQFHTLCDTYDFLRIDILGGQSIDDIIVRLKAGKTDYELEYKRYRAIKGDKSTARDAAFQLLFLILLFDFKHPTKDSNKVFNAVLFVVSHSGTFKWRIRTVVRAAYEERFVVSSKQKATLDRWLKPKPAEDLSDDYVTTEDDFSDYYTSDGS
uniref:Geranylgeranyl pyrophosphate synthetase n=1 Tax=Talaromyces marneffei PM1 TaxID=1077442 RepID=A0A093UMQ6_TALMA